MSLSGAPPRNRVKIACALLAAAGALSGCAIMPGELNLSPIYRHRLDRDGEVRELDVLWPLIHYETTEAGGVDFRIRPFYRYIDEEPTDSEDEHQYIWPLGRVHHSDQGETLSRFFPLWWYKEREDDLGLRETDWYVLALIWGGSRTDDEENYFAVLPFYADIPDFVTYDRFTAHMFPLHVRLEKDGLVSHMVPWPLIGWGSDPEDGRYWHRALPLYGVAVEPGRYERYTALWPFAHWGYENLHLEHPVQRFFLFPLFGRMVGDTVNSWTALWPLFGKIEIEDIEYKLDILWPFFRYRESSIEDNLQQWWLWPLVGHTESDDQDSWTALWPLIWIRRYDDPVGVLTQQWVLPFFWHTHRDYREGGEDDLLKIWPLWHRESDRDGSGNWSTLSPWPWTQGNAYGVAEAYDWLWSVVKGRYTRDMQAWHLAAHLFTTAERGEHRQTSVPFLFNYESHPDDGSVLRLFQFLPIRWGAPPEGQP